MAESTVIKLASDGTIVIGDGTRTYTIAYEEGNLNLTHPGHEILHYLDRGRITATPSVRRGDDQPMTFTFDCYFRTASDATYATAAEFLFNTGLVGSTWVSTLGANADVDTWTITYTLNSTALGDASNDVLVLSYCTLTNGSYAEGKPCKVSFSGTSYAVDPTVT